MNICTLQKNKCATFKISLIIPLTLGNLAVAKNYEKISLSVQEDSNIVTDDKSELLYQ